MIHDGRLFFSITSTEGREHLSTELAFLVLFYPTQKSHYPNIPQRRKEKMLLQYHTKVLTHTKAR